MAFKTKESSLDSPRCICHTSRCLKPIAFDLKVTGSLITLSEGGRLATRHRGGYCHGLVFSRRAVEAGEKVRLRVERGGGRWQGALRVGFGHVKPQQTALPPLAIPLLTESLPYCVMMVPETLCQPGAELDFWVDRRGCLCVRGRDSVTLALAGSLDVDLPLWAMVDVYGQTTAVRILGSRRSGLFRTRRTCSALKHKVSMDDTDDREQATAPTHTDTPPYRQRNLDNGDVGVEECVVCVTETANTRLSCGHSSFCFLCAVRIYHLFGSCPLCRQPLAPIPDRKSVCGS